MKILKGFDGKGSRAIESVIYCSLYSSLCCSSIGFSALFTRDWAKMGEVASCK